MTFSRFGEESCDLILIKCFSWTKQDCTTLVTSASKATKNNTQVNWLHPHVVTIWCFYSSYIQGLWKLPHQKQSANPCFSRFKTIFFALSSHWLMLHFFVFHNTFCRCLPPLGVWVCCLMCLIELQLRPQQPLHSAGYELKLILYMS